ncbi:MAG: ATP-dependent RecD-like DNA helicase [Verrucomicrobiota bacterium]|nr:ATP-dependent RecD-like DNA helicase [Verrucomicrobiota bacterium]
MSLFNHNNNKKSDKYVTDHQLRGEVFRVVYTSDDGGYSVVKLRTPQNKELVLVGNMYGVMEGQSIIVEGRWEIHKDHGKQLKVSKFKASLPCTEEGIRKYLASGLIPGIGPKLAERIVDQFGVETLKILDKYSGRLSEIDGFGKVRIKRIKKAWDEHSQQRDLYVYMQGVGITPAYCHRIYKKYGEVASEVIKKTPYKLASEVKGIGFLLADRIAKNLGVKKDSAHRLAAGIRYNLECLALSGHVCYPKEKLIEISAEQLGVEAEKVMEALSGAILSGLIVADSPRNINLEKGVGGEVADSANPVESTEFLYQLKLYNSEKYLAETIKYLISNHCGPQDIDENSLKLPVHLSSEQKNGIVNAFKHQISIITGGPGVGKTTAIEQIVQIASNYGMKVSMAAPTGRAAKRMSQTCGRPASTIHRLLKFDAESYSFIFNRDNPLKCDMLIIDEISMLDINLGYSLFQAITPNTKIVLIGDKDQLPSVGPGNVLNDLIQSARIPVTFLKEIFRQDSAGRIVSNSHAVNNGRFPDLSVPHNINNADFFWIDEEDPEKVNEDIVEMILHRIPQRYHYIPRRDIQLLVPMKKGACGTESLNHLVQDALNPSLHKPQFHFGEKSFRLNDRVMQTENNYDKKVFNGDLGTIKQIDNSKKTFQVNFEGKVVEFGFEDADQLILAYAITVHKSQGSEFPVVIMPLLTQHYIMLRKNLLYTAMTRAKNLLILIGSKKALGIALGNAKHSIRYSLLKLRLEKGGEVLFLLTCFFVQSTFFA